MFSSAFSRSILKNVLRGLPYALPAELEILLSMTPINRTPFNLERAFAELAPTFRGIIKNTSKELKDAAKSISHSPPSKDPSYIELTEAIEIATSLITSPTARRSALERITVISKQVSPTLKTTFGDKLPRAARAAEYGKISEELTRASKAFKKASTPIEKQSSSTRFSKEFKAAHSAVETLTSEMANAHSQNPMLATELFFERLIPSAQSQTSTMKLMIYGPVVGLVVLSGLYGILDAIHDTNSVITTTKKAVTELLPYGELLPEHRQQILEQIDLNSIERIAETKAQLVLALTAIQESIDRSSSDTEAQLGNSPEPQIDEYELLESIAEGESLAHDAKLYTSLALKKFISDAIGYFKDGLTETRSPDSELIDGNSNPESKSGYSTTQSRGENLRNKVYLLSKAAIGSNVLPELSTRVLMGATSIAPLQLRIFLELSKGIISEISNISRTDNERSVTSMIATGLGNLHSLLENTLQRGTIITADIIHSSMYAVTAHLYASYALKTATPEISRQSEAAASK